MNLTKRERKLRDELNRICNLLPGLKRIYEVERIAAEIRVEASMYEDLGADLMAERLEADALLLDRLAWDLHQMRQAFQPDKEPTGRYDPRHWRGARP